MKIPMWLENGFFRVIDFIYAFVPQAKPLDEKLKNIKIIAHRGAHGMHAKENTLEAFDIALNLGIFGIEFDVRWTKDLCPVVHHDENCQRIFSSAHVISQMTFQELRNIIPQVLSLEEVIQRYGKKLHLMVELKYEFYSDPKQQNEILAQLFSTLIPGIDYSIISLCPELFTYFSFAPSQTFFPIMSMSSKNFLQLVSSKNYGGLLGHYFFIDGNLIKKLRQQNRHVGIGFIASKNSLYREVNRGVEWIFTNHPARLKLYLDKGGYYKLNLGER